MKYSLMTNNDDDVRDGIRMEKIKMMVIPCLPIIPAFIWDRRQGITLRLLSHPDNGTYNRQGEASSIHQG